MRTNDYKINGYRVSIFTGKKEDFYLVSSDYEHIGLCYSIDTLAKLIETDAETIKSEIQEQRLKKFIDKYKRNKAEHHP